MTRYLLVILSAISLNSCFTGIESTPRITVNDVNKEHIVLSPEQKFLADISPEPIARWSSGKQFYVTDDRIALAVTSALPHDSLHLAGHTIVLTGVKPVNSITGEQVAVISFVTDTGAPVDYLISRPYEKVMEAAETEIPFTVEMSVVNEVSARIKGHRYYIVTPMWYDADGINRVEGLRHVPVDITDVVPGNDVYPLRVIFRAVDRPSEIYSVYMTTGDRRTSTLNFDRLLAFDNPRVRHPQITDEIWDLIIHSKVKYGMTKDECRLAFGYPDTIGQRPTTAGMVEYWSYSDGKILIFDEGLLSSFRH